MQAWLSLPIHRFKLPKILRVLASFTLVFFGMAAPQFAVAAAQCGEVFQSPPEAFVSKKDSLVAVFESGSKTYSLADSFAQKILAQDAASQTQWQQAIAEVYRLVPKKNMDPTAGWRIGGRPLLDRLLAKIQRADLYFAEQTVNRPAPEVLAKYLDSQGQLFKSGYGAKEVLAIAETLQNFLIHHRQTAVSQAPQTFFVGGSFMNAKAKLGTSDLDLSVTDASMGKLVPQIQQIVAGRLQEFNPTNNIQIEAHGEPAAFYGQRNALVLKIDHEKIELLVYPPAQRTDDRTLKALTPSVYRIR